MSEEKAKALLGKVKSGTEKATKYYDRIRTSLKMNLLEQKEKINKINDQIYDLEEFQLETNINKGQSALTKEECENKFKEIFEAKKNYELSKLEYDLSVKTFEEYFGEEADLKLQ